MSTGFQPLVINGKLERSTEDGFALVKSLKLNIRQNLKMLLLTSPGERVMAPRFGVGMRRYLFEMQSDEVFAAIDSKIREQVSIYLPYIKIQQVQFDKSNIDKNQIKLKLTYSVPRVSLNDVLVTDVL
tara:strand:+ start:1251 stop:1634 length:384 start_codon:yes stop_codon:yes gene_type:complete